MRSATQGEKAAIVQELHKEGHKLNDLLDVIGLSRSTYYYELGKTDKVKERNAELSSEISTIFNENRKRYGVRRVHHELLSRGFQVNHKRVQRIMNQLALFGKRPKEKYHSYKGDVGKVADNIINRDFSTEKPLQKWTTDVSQFNLPWGKCYISPILDMNTNEIISYNLSTSPNMEQIRDMLNKAFERFPSVQGLVMHSDQDWQYEETNFAVISDHGHLPVSRVLNPNVYLTEAGLIDVDENGSPVDWKAYCNSTSLSCQVVMKNPADEKTRAVLEKVLYGLRNDLSSGVESVFTKEECEREYHLAGDFEYVLEGRERTSFGNAWTGAKMVTPDNSDYKFSVASHGHLPHKGPQPVFIMAGPDVREGVVFERKRIIDEAPTFAAMLHFDMPQATGHAISEILK